MNTASLELCKQLYELSGWEDTQNNHYQLADKSYTINTEDRRGYQWDFICPAYDLGYLLRKLPQVIEEDAGLVFYPGKYTKRWYIGYEGKGRFGEANTPEDAACKLAIELIKQGIIKV
jgi:hypothetical protein